MEMSAKESLFTTNKKLKIRNEIISVKRQVLASEKDIEALKCDIDDAKKGLAREKVHRRNLKNKRKRLENDLADLLYENCEFSYEEFIEKCCLQTREDDEVRKVQVDDLYDTYFSFSCNPDPPVKFHAIMRKRFPQRKLDKNYYYLGIFIKRTTGYLIE